MMGPTPEATPTTVTRSGATAAVASENGPPPDHPNEAKRVTPSCLAI